MVAKSDAPPADNPAVRLHCKLALAMLACAKELKATRLFVVAWQLLHCGTFIGANVRAAQHAKGRVDFVHECKIAAKETGEIDY